MNILDYKRKARGYTFRGGYEGGGTDMGAGTGPDAGPMSGAETGLTGGTPGLGAQIAFANNQMADEAAMEAAGIKSAADYAAVGSQAAKPASFGYNFNAGTAAKTALGAFLGGPLGLLGGLASGISYSPATPGMPQLSYGGPTGYSPGSDTTSGGFSGGPGGGSDLAGALLLAGGITAGSGATAGAGAGAASNPADPFAPYRADLAKQYAGALTPGASSNIQAMPGYSQYNTGVMQPAMMAAQRVAATGGNLYGGGEKARLQTLGQQGYYNFMNDYMNRLAQGSGAINNPATAVGLSQEAARDAQRIQDANQKATMSNLGFGVQTFNQLGGFDSIKNLFRGSSTPYSSAGFNVGGSGGLDTSAYGTGLPSWMLANQDIYGLG